MEKIAINATFGPRKPETLEDRLRALSAYEEQLKFGALGSQHYKGMESAIVFLRERIAALRCEKK